jgi:hypothetical protein
MWRSEGSAEVEGWVESLSEANFRRWWKYCDLVVGRRGVPDSQIIFDFEGDLLALRFEGDSSSASAFVFFYVAPDELIIFLCVCDPATSMPEESDIERARALMQQCHYDGHTVDNL